MGSNRPAPEVVNKVDFVRSAGFPSRANSPLVIHSNTVKTNSVPRRFFKPVARRGVKVGRAGCGVQRYQLAKCDRLTFEPSFLTSYLADSLLCSRICERPDQCVDASRW